MIYTQKMKDAGELPKVGMNFQTSLGVEVAVYSNAEWVVYEDCNNHPVAISLYGVFPIKSQKEIESEIAKEKQLEDVVRVILECMLGEENGAHYMAKALQDKGLLAAIKLGE